MLEQAPEPVLGQARRRECTGVMNAEGYERAWTVALRRIPIFPTDFLSLRYWRQLLHVHDACPTPVDRKHRRPLIGAVKQARRPEQPGIRP